MDPMVLATVGAVTGIFGAISGIAGVIVAIRSYRTAKSIKALDLRIETQRARNDAHVAVVQLLELHERAVGSRKAVSSALGKLGSGTMQKWEAEWQQDQEQITELAAEVPPRDTSYDDFSAKELETAIVSLHRTKGWIDDLTQKYTESLAADDRSRAQISEANLQRLNPR